MRGFIHDISEKALKNSYFRQVLETGEHTQIVVMSIAPGGEIGEEVHTENDQVLYFVEGEGKAILDGEEVNFEKDDVVLVKAGIRHNFINTGAKPLKIYTIYSPANHPADRIQKTKADAMKEEY